MRVMRAWRGRVVHLTRRSAARRDAATFVDQHIIGAHRRAGRHGLAADRRPRATARAGARPAAADPRPCRQMKQIERRRVSASSDVDHRLVDLGDAVATEWRARPTGRARMRAAMRHVREAKAAAAIVLDLVPARNIAALARRHAGLGSSAVRRSARRGGLFRVAGSAADVVDDLVLDDDLRLRLPASSPASAAVLSASSLRRPR